MKAVFRRNTLCIARKTDEIRAKILSQDADDDLISVYLSLENQVRGDMPPCFLWHCVGDESVPVENSLLLASAMQRAAVDYECHLFAGGAHGISMCNREVETPNPEAAAWVELCKTWLNKKFNYIP